MPAREPPNPAVTIFVSGDGGVPDVAPDETPQVDSPEEASLDPSIANDESAVTELEEIIQQVVDQSRNVAAVVASTELPGLMETSVSGRATGTGGNPRGHGNTEDRGTPKRERRWFVEFSDPGDLESYAAQLDSLGIELGAMYTAEGRLVYMRNMSTQTPAMRETSEREASREQRLFMNWMEGSEDRRRADIELFLKASIDASAAEVLHFYSTETENQMATIETEYGGHSADEIRKTYFRVRKSGNAYEFYVFRQLLK